MAPKTVMYPYHPGECYQMRTYEDWLLTLPGGLCCRRISSGTGFDYLGEGGIGEVIKECDKKLVWPWWPSQKGLPPDWLIFCGFEKPGYYFRKALWTKRARGLCCSRNRFKPQRIGQNALFGTGPRYGPHWNHDTAGDTLAVHVYTNMPGCRTTV